MSTHMSGFMFFIIAQVSAENIYYFGEELRETNMAHMIHTCIIRRDRGEMSIVVTFSKIFKIYNYF